MKKNAVYIIAGSALVLGVLYFVYKQGKKSPSIAPIPTDTGGSSGSGVSLPNGDLISLAGEIYRDCIGLDIFAAHDESIYQRALALSNTDFVRLYNIFNSAYQPMIEDTMRGLINDQWAIPYSPWATIREAMMKRFDTLNLA